MKNKFIRFVLGFQGLYYLVTGGWAIVSLESFSGFTGHYGDAFEMHSMATLIVALGLFFLWGAANENLARPAGFLALGSAIAVALPELIHLPGENISVLFWLDFAEETSVAAVLAFLLFRRN